MSYYVKITQNTNRIIELIEAQVTEKTSGSNVAYHAEISPPNSLSDSSKLIDEILDQEPVITTNVERPLVFKKVKLLRVGNPSNTVLNIYEIQIWVNGINIAITGKADVFPGNYKSRRLTFKPSHAIDGVLSNHRKQAHSAFGVIGSYVMITLPDDIEFSDLQSVVIYNRDNRIQFKRRIRGCALQLLTSDDTVIYQSPNITAVKSYYRYDGPDIANGVLENSESNSAIINSGNLFKLNINITRNVADLPINFAKIYFSTLEKTVNFNCLT